MNILFSSSEVVPFAKTGGLADVSSALPKALSKLGHKVVVVMPRYYIVNRDTLEHIPISLGVPMGSIDTLWAGIYKSFLPNSNVEIYFIDYEEFFGRVGLYTDDRGVGYEDNDKRFAFLSKASMELAKAINFKPDIIHANDWHTAVQTILRDTRYLWEPHFAESATVLTIHNLQHQGVFAKEIMDILETGWEYFNPFEMESMGGANFLKGGISHADRITTVSSKYAQEIQSSEFGFGLEEHIKAHSYRLKGILNGVDYDEWSPKSDKYIPKNYDYDDIDGKKVCKVKLQERFNLPIKPQTPLIGFVGRFAQQKGISLIASIMEKLTNLDAQFIFLGSGEKWAEDFFKSFAKKYPDKIGSFIGYNNELSHQIEAGSDMFLMPSIFEPCGLNQIYSLRYGTLPIVRAVGGLDDTIREYNPNTKDGNGFKFWDATGDALFDTIKWAIDVYTNRFEDFRAMQISAMKERFDWIKSAKEYEKVYLEALEYRKSQRR